MIISNVERLDNEKKKLLSFKRSTLFIDNFLSLINNIRKSYRS